MLQEADEEALVEHEELERFDNEPLKQVEYFRLLDRNTDEVSDMVVLRNELQATESKLETETMDTPIVVVETPTTTLGGIMLEKLKGAWEAVNRSSKRTISCLMLLVVILAIVVVAVSARKSASPQEAPSETIWNNIRLPGSVVPSRYDVKLTIDMTNEFFTGSEDVYVTVNNETSVLLIHISNVVDAQLGPEMNITQYSVHQLSDGKVGSSLKVKNAFPFSQNNFFVMQMQQTVEPGEYVLKFVWQSRLVRGLDGIYISSYEENGENKKLLASQMEPLAARKVMPCFDEPDFKAKFNMEIVTENMYGLVLWNMPQSGETEKLDDKWNKYVFEESVTMSTYLLAFIIADFKCTPIDTTTDGVKVRTCGRANPIDKGAGDYSTEKTKEIIEVYEEFYGTKFPLTKIDSVAVPDFSAGAMENWGLILYRETALLYNPAEDTYSNKARVNVVVAHELAHQWFGNLVTMKWWNDLWLNEGFASYVEWIGTVKSEPMWNYLDYQTFSDRSRALSIDSYTSSRPTSIAVEKPADITAQFDSISYSKGSSLLVQAKMFMDPGDTNTENFEEAIRSYITTFQFDNTVQDDLYRKLDEVYQAKHPDATVDIVEVMNTWTLQMNFPVVEVRKYNDSHVRMSQKRFLISGGDPSDDKTSPYGYQWFVPIEYSVNDEATVFEWLKPHSTILVPFDFTDSNAFIHVNKGSAGYYIVDYSYELAQRLYANLKIDAVYEKLTVGERQGMLFDIFLFISAGSRPMSEGIDMLELMSVKELMEDSYIPLREISRQIAGVAAHISGDEDLNKKWKKKYATFATSMFDKYAKNYFMVDASSEEALPTDEVNYGFQQRSLVPVAASIGCAYDVQICIDAAKAKFEAYKTSGVELSPDFKSTVLSTVMADNTTLESDWDFLWDKYQNSQSASEKDVLYYALGLIQNEEVLLKFAGYCLDVSKVRRSDALYILGRSITQTKLGRDVSWEFMQDQWESLGELFKDSLFAVDAYISGVLSGFSDEESLSKIETFFSTRMESLGAGRAAYQSAIQSIKANIAWLKENKPSVEAAVKDITLP